MYECFLISDKRVEDWFMMDAYWKTWAGVILYLLIVWIGPKLMEHREPMKLRYPIVIYNALMVLLNFHIFYEVRRHIFTPFCLGTVQNFLLGEGGGTFREKCP